jgi:glycosyltransferase involved in cell wall biosynthesis
VDIVHRPFQPHGPLPLQRWMEIGRRLVVTIQDLIGYNNGYYHPTSLEWLTYRLAMAETLQQVDSVVAISQDTEQAIRGAGMLPFAAKLTVVPNGTDHLSGMHQQMSVPQALLERGSPAIRFALVLGTSYAHKNRDLAIKAWQELRQRGHQLELVMAGVVVPVGSTRNEEVLAAANGPQPIVLPDVSDSERNWLLRHATVVLYPTSAEGFGLVPFEAAEFDTPTVFVSFGPLAEFLDGVPVAARDWTPKALADAIGAVVSDPGVASAQVAAVKKVAAGLTWDSAAEQLVRTYLDALARPSGRPG